ncbi:hypothetical protein MLD38_019865 [Melastoma candidum]|uniref:Uncharacterized protein n=1 Tax=Melastoma candidum TaxID=119954 RepID=A0ACB9QAS7_9MYRT|nr:hypothetical protein MLD38_019865 [Melastoma candidum]
MGERDPWDAPKLPIFSMPRQHAAEAPGLRTPPLHPGAAIPFLWEEAPGKPMPWLARSPYAPPVITEGEKRSLDLPPGLLTPWLARSPYAPPVVTEGEKRSLDLPPGLLTDGHDATAAASDSITVSSPNTVSEGTYPRHRKRVMETWSFRCIGSREKAAFGSLRWDSLGSKVPCHDRKKIETPRGDSHGLSCRNCDQEEMDSGPKVKIIRVKRRRSFLILSPNKSHLWASICEGFKQVVRWRRCSTKNNGEEATNS